jgi:hypothetical protein
MIRQIFEKSKKDKEIIGIRLYKDEDDFWLGFIEDFNDEIIQLRHFDQFGLEDGLVIEQMKGIDSIDYGSSYEKSFQYLINKQYDLKNLSKIADFKNSDNWRHEYLKDFKGNDCIIAIEFNKEYVIYGFVHDLDDTEFTLNGVDNIGEDGGMTIYRIEDITALKLVDRKCILRHDLNKWRKKTSGH